MLSCERIASISIMYFPSGEDIMSINSYLNIVDHSYIYDNSPFSNFDKVLSSVDNVSKLTYVANC
ncbi:hypothetical protein FACS1894184_06040 [Clostridia bacterium]|nr:hypothetical protein FACS1894184_06040 [Clostridia bacterium]